MDLKGVFNSEPKSLFDTLSEAGLCFYLPAYQRPYTWNTANIDRIFEDVVHGLENTISNEDAITFIGTILTIHDTKFETIVPHKKGEVPAKVMLVIDGQQRLSSMLIIITLLHDFLKEYESKITIIRDKLAKKDSQVHEDEINDLEWLLDNINQEAANLRYFSTDTNSNRDKIYRWYPKLIRAYKDCWSKTKKGAMYDSPIARYLHHYNQHTLACEEESKYTKFKYSEGNTSQNIETHKTVIQNIKRIQKRIRTISNTSIPDAGHPTISELMSGTFSNSFQFDIPESLLSREENKDTTRKILNIIMFSKYFLNRVCVTYVTVTDEAYAFDMFEALNTTGEPLTSIETFKPKVIETEGLSNYEHSESKTHFDLIDGHLDIISNAEQKHKQTTRIMLSFALSETGEKLTKHISNQRRYLINSYKDEDLETKNDFVKNLAYVTKFYYEEWDAVSPSVLSDPSSERNITNLCLDVLRSSAHEITIPLITRFYSAVINSNYSEETKGELKRALKSIFAFFILWRAAHKNTAGIDTVYRDLLKKGDPGLGIQAFSRRSLPEVKSAPLSLYLGNQLKTKLGASNDNIKEKWIQAASQIPVYDVSKPLARIMILASFHDTCPDKTQPGLMEKGTKNSRPMLSWHKWKLFDDVSLDNKFTIEHIAPQTITDDWDQYFHEEKELTATLGNLTILPSKANSSASNKSWAAKKKYYRALCEARSNQKDEAVSEFTENQQVILAKAQYLGHLESISGVENWTSDLVKSRSKNMLGHVWDNLESWLYQS